MRPSWCFVACLVASTTGSACAHAAPLQESAAGRAAIRGARLEDAHESEELKALRSFEESSFERGPGDEAERATPPWLASAKLPDLGVRFDDHLLRYLEFYKNDRRGRGIMASWLKALGRYRAHFERALGEADLPTSLVYVAMIESGFEPHTRSPAGAVGLWQFMPAGARIYGLRVDYWVDERKSPERATDAVVRYFADLKERFGSWPLALAAFNAGYGAVLRSVQRYNTNDYWELCRHENGLPWETTLYVPKVMATAIVSENRALFGFDQLTADPALKYETATVKASTSFESLARGANVSPSQIAALNPELRRGRTPPERWTVRVPLGAGPRLQAALDGGSLSEALATVTVRHGEPLDELARRAGLSLKELRALNAIDDRAEIRPGLTLLVPEGRRPLPVPAGETVLVAVPNKDAAVAGRQRLFYRVQAHDSLSEIARLFHVTTAELGRWNKIDPHAKLIGGMVLQVFAPSSDTIDRGKVALIDPARIRLVTTGSTEFFDLSEAQRGRKRLSYAVKAKDDLKRIAKRFGLTVGDLERINRLSKTSKLKVGQRLTVYVPMSAAEKHAAKGTLTPSELKVPAPPAGPDPGVEPDAFGTTDEETAEPASPLPPPPAVDAPL